MRCESCGAELIAGKRFCPACGAPAAIPCPTCGATVAPAYRFCPDCGTRLGADAPPRVQARADDRLARLARHIPPDLAAKITATRGSAVAGERKLVTVMFCDLVGSTALAEHLDPEDYRDLLDEYLALAFREIYRVDGIVNQLAGDGLMALFGAPVAHEDAPTRALLAALAIRDALAALPDSPRSGREVVLRARIGVHTGPVVVGTVGNDLKMDYTAIGDTTNLAARLQAAAEPGTILVSEPTERLVRGRFTLRAVGPLDLKGKSEPVAAYEVVAARASTPMGIAIARGLTPFVGRTAELSQLRACYEQLTGDLAQVVAVVGDAGSGKSRLLYEFKARLRDEPVSVLEGRCAALNQMVPYAPFVTMLRGYFDVAPDASPAVCEQVGARLRGLDAGLCTAYPAMCRLLSVPIDQPAEAAAEIPAAERKREIFDAVARFVLTLSARNPTILLFEDVQWIDELSRELLEVAASRLQQARVMLVVSHRPDHELSWRTSAAFTRLTLRRLSDGDTTAIIRSLVGNPLPAELERRLLLKADGNPFVTEELTRTLLEGGYVVNAGDSVRLTRAIGDIPIPDTIQEIVGARLDRLGTQHKRVVQVAAVLGRQFRRDHLANALDGEAIDLDALLDDLERRGIVHRKNVLSTDEFRFGESLTQEVAYEGLLLRERRQLHARVARMLEALPGVPTPERSTLIAHHFARSDEQDRAVEALLGAARTAEELPSYAMAVDLYRQAWELAEAAIAQGRDGSDRAQLWALRATMGLCRLTIIYGAPAPTDIDAVARRGRELAERLGNVEALAAMGSLHGMHTVSASRESFERGVAMIEDALEIARRGGLAASASNVSRALALSYVMDGRLEAARERIDWVLSELERSGEAGRLADVYFGACWVRDTVRLYGDDLPGVISGATDVYEKALRVHNRTAQAGFTAKLAHAHLLRAEYETARDWAMRCLAVAEEIDNTAAMLAAAAVVLVAGPPPRDPASRYVGLVEHALGEGSHFLMNAPLVVEALLAGGEIQRAERAAELSYSRAGGRLREALSLYALAEVMLARGPTHREAAARQYAHAIRLAEIIGARSTLACARVGQADLAGRRGGASPAERDALRRALADLERLGFIHHARRARRLLAEPLAAGEATT
jgi:class 3 adenylate cyclase/tetratricopeptide (TPR) repeat protein